MGQRAQGRADERERALRAVVTTTLRRADTARTAYRLALRRAEDSERRVRALRASRGRAVASTDSALARVDSVLPMSLLPDSLAATVRTLMATVRAERLVSDSVILSLEQTVALKDSALTAADSVISAQASVIASQVELVRVLDRKAHPSLVSRTLSFARHAAIGAAVMAVVMVTRQ